MAQTRPTSEQLRFRSAYTGEHVLDTYLEAAERGGRSLQDLMSELFDTNGDFRSDNFQFRYDPVTNALQARLGQHLDQDGAWVEVVPLLEDAGTFSNATTYENLQLVTDSVDDVYIVHSLTAPQTFADEATFRSSDKTTKLVNVSKAREWAIKTGSTVDGSEYSAKYHAQAAASSATAASSSQSAAASSASAASTSEANALTYRNAAQTAQTAAETAQTGAETARTGSEAAQTAAETAQAAAEAAQLASENVFDSFDDRYLGAKASDPTLDNDGNALVPGALYWNTTDDNLRFWTGSIWQVYGAGTLAVQDANNVAITGGAIDGTAIGGTTPAAGTFTTLTGSGDVAIATDVLFVDTTNNRVGIRTANPAYELDVDGVARFSQASGNGTIRVVSSTTGTSAVYLGDTAANANGRIAYNNSLDLLQLFASNTAILNANSTGVGIGTTSPDEDLHVQSTGNPTILIKSTFTGGVSAMQFDNAGDNSIGRFLFSKAGVTAGGIKYDHATGGATQYMGFNVAGGADKMTLTGAGRLGINNTAPSSDLHVGNGTGSVSMIIQAADAGASNIYLGKASNGLSSSISLNHSTSEMVFRINSATIAALTASGRLGLNTTSPGATLDVNGNARIGSIAATSGQQGLVASPSASYAAGVQVRNFDAVGWARIDLNHSSASDSAFLYQTSSGAMYFRNDSTASTPFLWNVGTTTRMVLNSSGNVGIGTTSPSEALHVVGNILTTGRVRSKDGTTGDVGLGFGSDHNVGLIRPAADTISIVTASAQRLTVDPSGRVGLGTTAPNRKVEIAAVANSINRNDGLRISTTGAVGTAAYRYGDAKLMSDGVGTFRYSISVKNDDLAGTEYEAISIPLSSGNVGIGTTAPEAHLHTLGATASGGIFVDDSSFSSAAPAVRVLGRRQDGNTSSAFAGKIALEKHRTDAAVSTNQVLGSVIFGGNHTDGTEANIAYPASIVAIADGAFNSASDMPTGLAFFTGSTGQSSLDNPNVSFGTEAMRILSSGNVGIGTTSPDTALHVDSGETNRAATFESTDPTVTLAMLDNNTTATGNGPNVLVRTGDTTSIYSGGSERLTILGTGATGIGTTSPSEALHVIGNARIHGSVLFDTFREIKQASSTAQGMGLIAGTSNTTGASVSLYGSTNSGQAGNLFLTSGGAASTGSIIFRNYDGSSFNTQATISNDGSATFEGDLTTKGLLATDKGFDLTISAGVITVTHSFHTVAAETGTTDTLDTINGGHDGAIILLMGSQVQEETITYGTTGNIHAPADATLGSGDTHMFIYDGTSSEWRQVS